jgi:hypothetical protein
MIDRFKKNRQISNSMEIRPVGAELFRADRRTNMTNLTVDFRKFANAPNTALTFRYTESFTLNI